MKHLLIAILIVSTMAAFVGVAALWQSQTREPSPQDEQVTVLKNQIAVENLRLQQEKEAQKTALLTAKLAKERAEQERQAKIQDAPVVVKSRVTLMAFLYVLPILLTASALIGLPCYAVFRHVYVETPFYKGNLPAKKAFAVAERSLNVSNAAELAKAMAFAEELSQQRLKTDADVLKSLRAGRESVTIQQALPAATEQVTPMTPHVPTFDELLRAGKFEPGKPMVFGFKEQGGPKTGTWKDAYSLGIAGESGSGKSTTIRCVIAQSFLTQAVGKAFFLDPHYPHPESLLASMGDLIHAPQVRYAENRIETLDLIDEIHGHIDRRLAGQEPSEPLMIVVVDELPVLVKKFPKIAELMEKIGMESRKAGVYGIFAAQSWNGDKVGGTTARDNLTALMVHAMKRKQANTLLQDNDLAKQVDKLRRGQVLFSPTQGKPEILTVPYCAIEDMPEVVRRLANGGVVSDSVQSCVSTQQRTTVDTTGTADGHGDAQLFRAALNACQNDKKTLAATSGVSESLLTKIEKGERSITDATRQKLQAVLTGTSQAASKVIPFPQK